MFRFLLATMVCAAGLAMAGDEDTGGDSGNAVPHASLWRKFQFHGTLAQGFIYGSGNNYMSMNTNDGSAKWSEGAVNASFSISDNFRVGAQLHAYTMGQLGRLNPQVDWAYADYRLKDWLGFRGGKLKAPGGLYNDIQDTDTLYNWALLPQSIYEADMRSYNLPIVGGEIYGKIKLPVGGSLDYQIYGGQRGIANNDGVPLLIWQYFHFAHTNASGYTYGGDFKWKTPIRGLTAGVTFDNSRPQFPNSMQPAAFNIYHVPGTGTIDAAFSKEIYSLQYVRGKLELDAEGIHKPHYVALYATLLGMKIKNDYGTTPRDGWYLMGSYHLTAKLTAGSYFSRLVGTSIVNMASWPAYDPSKPSYYSNDTVANVRYDFNRFFYAKLEGHYIDGVLGPFFPANNPSLANVIHYVPPASPTSVAGIPSQKVTRLIMARFGFTF